MGYLTKIDADLTPLAELPPDGWLESATEHQVNYWHYLRCHYGTVYRMLAEWFGHLPPSLPKALPLVALGVANEEYCKDLRNTYLALYGCLVDGWFPIMDTLRSSGAFDPFGWEPDRPSTLLMCLVYGDCLADWQECLGFYNSSPRNEYERVRLSSKEALLGDRDKEKLAKLRRSSKDPGAMYRNLKRSIIRILRIEASKKGKRDGAELRQKLKEFDAAMAKIEAHKLKELQPKNRPARYQWNRGKVSFTGL